MPGGETVLTIIDKNMKPQITNQKSNSARTIVGLLVLVAMLAMLLVPLVRAIEIPPAPNFAVNIGSGYTTGTPIGYRIARFIPDGWSVAITNSGTGVLVTNDWGCTNLNVYKRLTPGSMLFTTNTYVTNGLISPFYWLKDGTNAIFQQVTGVPAWNDVAYWSDMNGTVTTNVSFFFGINGATTATTNTGTVFIYKTTSGRYYETNAPFSFTYGPIIGTNVWYTNVTPTTAFLSGASGFRATIVAGTNSPTTTNYISDFGLGGFVGVGVGR